MTKHVLPGIKPPWIAFLAVVLWLPGIVTAQSTAEVIADAAVEVSPDDLSAVLNAVGEARVVLLGEGWHGDGGAIALRTRLVESLHEQLGFDVLVFEADFFAIHHDWERFRAGGSLDPVRDDVWAFWSRSSAATALWGYIEAQAREGDTLHVAGIDTQVHSATSRDELPDWLRTHLLALPDAEPEEVEAVAAFFAAVLGADGADPAAVSDDTASRALGLLRRLEREATDTFVSQAAESVRRNLSGESRDPGMGDNLVWLATEHYRNRKVIVWAHNNHVLMDKWVYWDSPAGVASRVNLSDSSLADQVYLGDVVRRAFGPAAYSIATVPYEGRYSPDVVSVLRRGTADLDSTLTLAAAPPETVEAALARRHAFSFVKFQPLRCHVGAVPSRVLHYAFDHEPLALRIADGWDGLLFMRRTYGLNDDGFSP